MWHPPIIYKIYMLLTTNRREGGVNMHLRVYLYKNQVIGSQDLHVWTFDDSNTYIWDWWDLQPTGEEFEDDQNSFLIDFFKSRYRHIHACMGSKWKCLKYTYKSKTFTFKWMQDMLKQYEMWNVLQLLQDVSIYSSIKPAFLKQQFIVGWERCCNSPF